MFRRAILPLILLALAAPAFAQTAGNPKFSTVEAGSFKGPLTGNAATASALTQARTFALTGDAGCSFQFDGSANTGCTLTLANSGVAAGTYGSTTAVPAVTVDAKGRVTGVAATPIAFPVTTVAGRTGAVALAVADVSGAAPLASPNFTGTLNAPTGKFDALSLRNPTPNQPGFTGGFASEVGGVANGLLGSTTNNQPACTTTSGSPPCIFPVGTIGYGNLLSPGNTVFGLFGRADCRVAGACTNEVNSFNFNVDAPTAYPWNRGFGTTQTVPVALTVAAGGTKTSAAGIEIAREGEAPSAFQYGITMRKDAANVAGLIMDADASTGPATNAILRNTGQGSNLILDMQTTGTTVAANPVMRHRNASGTTTFSVLQDGSVTSGAGYLAQSANFPFSRILNTAAPTDAKLWEWISFPDGSLRLRAANEAYTSTTEAINIARSGPSVSNITFSSPATFSSAVTAPTAAANTNTTQVATTAFVNTAIAANVSQGAMTSYTPTVTASSGSFGQLGTVTGRYQYINKKLIFFQIVVPITNVGTATGTVFATLPMQASSGGFVVIGRETSATGNMLQGLIAPNATQVQILTYNNQPPAASGSQFLMSGTYEVP